MAQAVAERANINDNIVNAAKLIGRSKHRRAVFEAIYFGKTLWKAASAIAKRTRLPRKRVLEEGVKIVHAAFATQKKLDGDVAYARDPSLYPHKAKIFAAAGDRKKLAAIPTRVNPHIVGGTTVRVTLARANLKPGKITIDDVASFKAVAGVKTIDPKAKLNRMAEARIKNAFKAIIGETHEFTDWGGEKNDLFTDKLRLATTRKQAAFAFKGKATQGTLTPKKMGKNGDQVGRLFSSEAEVFFVVYHGKIDESVHTQMYAHAVAKSSNGQAVRYGVIDGDDLNRLYQAYRKHF
jgi:hypothetical protein